MREHKIYRTPDIQCTRAIYRTTDNKHMRKTRFTERPISNALVLYRTTDNKLMREHKIHRTPDIQCTRAIRTTDNKLMRKHKIHQTRYLMHSCNIKRIINLCEKQDSPNPISNALVQYRTTDNKLTRKRKTICD